MGIFKDMRDTAKNLNELTQTGKEMQKEKYGTNNPFSVMNQGVAEANAVMQQVQQEQALMTRLMTVGIVGQGVLKALRDTGVQVNMQPQFEIDLDVTVPGKDTYPVTITRVVQLSALPMYQPGSTWPVKVDPDDPNVVIIG